MQIQNSVLVPPSPHCCVHVSFHSRADCSCFVWPVKLALFVVLPSIESLHMTWHHLCLSHRTSGPLVRRFCLSFTAAAITSTRCLPPLTFLASHCRPPPANAAHHGEAQEGTQEGGRLRLWRAPSHDDWRCLRGWWRWRACLQRASLEDHKGKKGQEEGGGSGRVRGWGSYGIRWW